MREILSEKGHLKITVDEIADSNQQLVYFFAPKSIASISKCMLTFDNFER